MDPEDLDRIFDEGEEDMTPYLDVSKARRPGLELRRVNVDLPDWVISALNKESRHVGVSRQSLIKLWLVERIEAEAARRERPKIAEFVSDAEDRLVSREGITHEEAQARILRALGREAGDED